MKKITLFLLCFLATYFATAQNNPPVAGDDLFIVKPGKKSIGTVSQNDSDPDADDLSYTLIDNVDDGFLRFCKNGSFCYIPDIGFTGVDGFEYEVTDNAAEDSANVSLIIGAPQIINTKVVCVVPILPCVYDDPDTLFYLKNRDWCEVSLQPSSLDLSELLSPSNNLVQPPNDTCDYFIIEQPPTNGEIYLTNVNDANIDSTFYYQQDAIGPIPDSMVILKCGDVNGDILCNSITYYINPEYESDCGYTIADKYCCISTTQTFPCNVLANDLVALDSLFPADSNYMIIHTDIINVTQPDSGSVVINSTSDSLIYDPTGFGGGIDSLTYQTQFTVVNGTGDTLTFVSDTQPVQLFVENCFIQPSNDTLMVTIGETLCFDVSNYFTVDSELSSFCPGGTDECTNSFTYDVSPIDSLISIECIDGNCCASSDTITKIELEYEVCAFGDCETVIITVCFTEPVPTLSQWSLFILTLLLLSLSTIAITKEAWAANDTQTNQIKTPVIPFDKTIYFQLFPKMWALIPVFFILIYLGWGEITGLDVLGTLVSIGLITYITHLAKAYYERRTTPALTQH